jgi:hypothetical protein
MNPPHQLLEEEEEEEEGRALEKFVSARPR